MNRPLADSIYIPGASPSPSIKKRYLIFFITGNPGLIEYYDAFLAHLNMLLTSKRMEQKSDITFDLYGASIAGFDFAPPDAASQRWRSLGLRHAPPFSLDEIINAMEVDLWRVIESVRHDGEELGIVVMGHSLGSFITLELIQRHRRQLEKVQKGPCIVGGVCLFATVIEIAESERGKALSTLASFPLFWSFVPMLCNLVLFLIPSILINAIVHRVEGLTGHCADATTAFLRSKYGVTQALHMGADEMAQISSDKWDDEVWGASHPSSTGIPRPKLFLYFGEKDHWVADRTREKLIKVRGRGIEGTDAWKPTMEIDEGGIPHSFCICEYFSVSFVGAGGMTKDENDVMLTIVVAHSIPVAEKVKKYIDEIVESHLS